MGFFYWQQLIGYDCSGQYFCIKGRLPIRNIYPTFVFPQANSVFSYRAWTNSCVQPLNLYLTISNHRNFYHKVLFGFFGDRPWTAKNSFQIFCSTNHYSSLIDLHKLYGRCPALYSVFNEKRAIDLIHYKL